MQKIVTFMILERVKYAHNYTYTEQYKPVHGDGVGDGHETVFLVGGKRHSYL